MKKKYKILLPLLVIAFAAIAFVASIPKNYDELMWRAIQKITASSDGRLHLNDQQFPERSFSVMSPPQSSKNVSWRHLKNNFEHVNFPPMSFKPLDNSRSTNEKEILIDSILLYATTLTKNVYGQTTQNFDINEYIRQDIESLKKDLPEGNESEVKFFPNDIPVNGEVVAKIIAIQNKNTGHTAFRGYVLDSKHDVVGMVMLMTPNIPDREYAKLLMADYFGVIQSFKFEGIKKQ